MLSTLAKFTLLLFVIVGACSPAPAVVSPSGIINRFGRCPSPDGTLTLTVSKLKTSIVNYDVSRSADASFVVGDHIGSDAQRWCFYWDEQNRLWAYSSDTGYFRIIAVERDGTVKTTEVDRTTPLPKPIYDFIPSSLKKGWGI